MLNFAILSAGNIAGRMARTLDSLRDEVQPYAIAARDSARAQALAGRYGFAKSFAGYEALLADPAIDAVSICAANTAHAELTIAALLLASRKISQGITWVKEQSAAGADISAVVEKGKSAYVGPEIMGKTLGVVGLGAIGVLVANAAAALGMNIVGYDPFLSVKHALNLTPGVEVVGTLDELYAKADYITLHLPMTPDTKGTLNEAAFAAMKDGVRVVNLARGELVDTAALKAAMDSGKCAAYVTDFPNSDTAAIEGVVAIPHLGASTPESEDNCAMMAAREIKDYLDNGNIVNSVNLPVLSMPWAAKTRVCVITKNADGAAVTAAVPAVASAFKARGDYGYYILDTDAAVDAAAIAAIPGVLRVRVLSK